MKKIMISVFAALLVCGSVSAQATAKKADKPATPVVQKAKAPAKSSGETAKTTTAAPKPAVKPASTNPAIKRKHTAAKKKPATKK